MLSGLSRGDEVIMPSWTFTSTANAFVLRGCVPVFVDVSPTTLTLDLAAAERAITKATRAIVSVNYGGSGPDMAGLRAICDRHGLILVEDAAQAIGAKHQGIHYGTFGRFGCLSFHSSKNIVAGEGGALLVNDPNDAVKAEIFREKGTDRSRFLRGEVDKYSWCDFGSSFLLPEIAAAMLGVQLRAVREITEARVAVWLRYHESLAELVAAGDIRVPQPSASDSGNGHIYWVMCRDSQSREALRAHLATEGICAVTHYVPLHSAPAGRRFGRVAGNMAVTDDAGATLLRLPLWAGMQDADTNMVIDAVKGFFRSRRRQST